MSDLLLAGLELLEVAELVVLGDRSHFVVVVKHPKLLLPLWVFPFPDPYLDEFLSFHLLHVRLSWVMLDFLEYVVLQVWEIVDVGDDAFAAAENANEVLAVPDTHLVFAVIQEKPIQVVAQYFSIPTVFSLCELLFMGR